MQRLEVSGAVRHIHGSLGVKRLNTAILPRKSVVKTSNKKKTSSFYDCTVEDVEYICNSNSTLVD